MAKAKSSKKTSKAEPAEVRITWREGPPHCPGLWIVRFYNGDQTLWKVEMDRDEETRQSYLRMTDNETSEPLYSVMDPPVACYGPCPHSTLEPGPSEEEKHIQERVMRFREDLATVLETLKTPPPDLDEALKDPVVLKEIGQCVTDLFSVIDEHVELFQEAHRGDRQPKAKPRSRSG